MDSDRIERAAPEDFPPYGNLSSLFVQAIASGKPGEWAGIDFAVFLERIANLYAAVLWPNWGPGGWQDGSAKNRMGLITAADYAILQDYQQPGNMVLDQIVDSPAGQPPYARTHHDLFADEDVTKFGKPFGSQLNDTYNAGLSFTMVTKVGQAYSQGLGTKVGGSVLKLKEWSQRPRPYQMAKLFGFGIRNEQALNGNSPALFCGHCLQGLLAGAAALTLVTPGSPAELALLQNMVDMGDRRVFAGVHYPSDNIASWLLALTMAPAVYTDPAMRGKIWQAIQMGEVYDSVKGGGRKGAYGPALDALIKAATGDLDWMAFRQPSQESRPATAGQNPS